jgi:eukaryotic-like serine/threonine-protein kinase
MLDNIEHGCSDTARVLCPSTFPEGRVVIREGMTEANAVEEDADPSSKRLLNVPASEIPSGGMEGDEAEMVRDDELLAGDELTTEYRPLCNSGGSARITDPYRECSQERELSPEVPRQRRFGGPPPMPPSRSKEQPMGSILVTQGSPRGRSERVSTGALGPNQRFETERPPPLSAGRAYGDEVRLRFSEASARCRHPDLEDLREGDVLFERYRVTRIATDGMILRVDATRIGLGSAAHILLLSANAPNYSEAREHFVRTGRMVAQLQSEHIARVVELGISASAPPYIITDRHGYADLSELIRVRGALGVTDAIDYAIQISEAMAEAHSQGVIHGSLRPSNVFISEGADGTPQAKLVGFGAPAQWSLSSHLGTSSQHVQIAAGSVLPYLAPEQIRSPGVLNASSDIWSLGVMLHEMLLGVPAFRGNSSAGMLAMIAADVAPSIAAVRADVSRTLESVVMRCLEKRSEARYENIIDLARALQPFGSPDSETIVERIVRIGARSQMAPSGFVRPQNALVRMPMRNGLGSGAVSSVTSRLPATLTPLHLGALAGTVVLLGAIAGVAGAVVVSHSLRATPSLSAGRNSKPLVHAREDIVEPDQRGTNSSAMANRPAVTVPSTLQVAPSAPSGAQVASRTVPSLSLTVSKALRLDAKPAVTSQSRVTRGAEVKKSEVTGDQLFNDIN